MRTTFPLENEGLLDSRTDSAQILPESEPPKMKFPKVIRHRKAEVTIYGKKKFRCFSLMGNSSFSITFKMSSHTLRFSLNDWLRSRYAG